MMLVFSGYASKTKVVSMNPDKNPVTKKVLSNGMTVLVRQVHTIPKVSIQLWYKVGSVDEKDNERGIAHLIEHMIFKGTKKLSESDINVVTHMLSGSCNAFTSYDFTGYLFNFPTHHWQEALNIMSDCMRNCSFKEEMLSSEMKAVIQELKMYRDHYMRSLIDEMIGTIFADHPYHYPIIGYKQDLWSVSSDGLRAFYKKHYLPNNATLIVVGDVDSDEVFALAEKKFGSIEADPNYKKEKFYFNQDIVSKSVVFYRAVEQPKVIYTFVVPGVREKKDHILELVARILGKGKSSRLYKKLVNELQLATSLDASTEELFDHGLFFVACEPKRAEDIAAIEHHIREEIERIAKDGIDDAELTRAIKQTQMSLYSLLEDTEHQAFEIGKYFLATGDENYIFNYLNQSHEQLKQQIQEVLAQYFRPSVMHIGKVLPLPETEQQSWADLQARSDEEDKRILSARIRTSPVEPPVYAKTVQVKEPQRFDFPKARTFTMGNGLKVLHYHNATAPKIDLILELKAKYYYDPEDKQGLAQFVSRMLLEGTEQYTAQELTDAIESRGMSIAAYPGGISISMLSEDLPFGLEILNEILTKALFDEKEIEKVRAQLLAKIKRFWDEPRYFAGQLIKEQIYKGHPYSKNSIGTANTITAMKRDDLLEFYKQYISPHGARLAIVGDWKEHDLQKLFEKQLGAWQGPEVEDITFPQLKDVDPQQIDYPINRDQVVLRFARLSIDRKHPDYDKLLLFDQIFSGGALGSMSSQLFQLRERSGLFYTIGGSLIAGASEQPGMFAVQTIVSLDRLQEAEKAIKGAIDKAPDAITPQEFAEAKHAVINSLVDNFESNHDMAQVFLFIDRFNFPGNFFDNRAADLNKIDSDTVKKVAKKLLQSTALMTLRVGRVAPKKA